MDGVSKIVCRSGIQYSDETTLQDELPSDKADSNIPCRGLSYEKIGISWKRIVTFTRQ